MGFLFFFYSHLDIWPWAFAFTPGILVILILPEVNSARRRTREAQGREKQSCCIGSANCSFALEEILQIQIAHTVNTRHKRGYLCGNWQQSRSSELCENTKKLTGHSSKTPSIPSDMLLGFGYKNREYYFSYVHKQYVQWDAGRTVQLARLLSENKNDQNWMKK